VPHGDESVFLRGQPKPVDESGPVVLFFGTLMAYKGLDLLLEAFERVRARRPESSLVVAGTPSGDFDLEELRRTADRIGGISVHPGYVPIPQVASFFNEARVVVAPYRYANASGVVELARTFARPVVGTAVGDLPAVIEDGRTGLLVPPNDPAALATALLRLLDDPAEAQRLGSAGRARSAASASWATVAERIEEVYIRALNDRHGGAVRTVKP
jgi:glycosyltransferase involved in cell wall biosynthesis